MLALLGNAGVIDDPAADRRLFFKLGQHERAHGREQFRLIPRRFRNKVVQRLVLGTDLIGSDARRHRLNALSCARQEQPRAVGRERTMPVGVTDDVAQMFNVLRKTRRHALRGSPCHSHLRHSLQTERESAG